MDAFGCTSYYEGTELKANHNDIHVLNIDNEGCTSYYEGTELKANHNITGKSSALPPLY